MTALRCSKENAKSALEVQKTDSYSSALWLIEKARGITISTAVNHRPKHSSEVRETDFPGSPPLLRSNSTWSTRLLPGITLTSTVPVTPIVSSHQELLSWGCWLIDDNPICLRLDIKVGPVAVDAWSKRYSLLIF